LITRLKKLPELRYDSAVNLCSLSCELVTNALDVEVVGVVPFCCGPVAVDVGIGEALNVVAGNDDTIGEALNVVAGKGGIEALNVVAGNGATTASHLVNPVSFHGWHCPGIRTAWLKSSESDIGPSPLVMSTRE